MKNLFKLLSIIFILVMLTGCKKYKSYNFKGKTYNNLEEIDNNEIIEYAKVAAYLFVEKDYNNFTYDDIAVYIAYSLLVTEQTATEEEVKTLVKDFFGITDYNLKAGKYKNVNKLFDEPFKDNEIIITKKDGIYKSNIGGTGIPRPTNIAPTIIFKKNKIIINYTYGNYGMRFDDIKSIIGYTKMEFKYNGNSLVLDKITYKENKEN